MRRRQKQRLFVIAFILSGVVGAVALTFNALQDNLLFFITPSDIVQEQFNPARAFRLGGMVAQGSVRRGGGDDGLRVEFVVTDFAESVPVHYIGILPDLFREGQGVVAQGVLRDGVFVANEVLAKHDENYLPPEVAEALQKTHRQ